MKMEFKHKITREIVETINPVKVTAATQWAVIYEADGSSIEIKSEDMQARIIFENGHISLRGEFKVMQRNPPAQKKHLSD